MPVSVTLSQEKTVLADSFRVVSWITAAEPADLYPLFVMDAGLDVWSEVYVRVATLDDIARYVENPLTQFAQTGYDFNTDPSPAIAAGDKIIITSAVPEWLSSFVSDLKFPLATYTGTSYVQVASSKPFPDARSGLSWELWNAGETVMKGSGSAGYSARYDASEPTWLRRHLTSLYDLVSEAEAHAIAVDTGVESIAKAAATTTPPFADITTETYP